MRNRHDCFEMKTHGKLYNIVLSTINNNAWQYQQILTAEIENRLRKNYAINIHKNVSIKSIICQLLNAAEPRTYTYSPASKTYRNEPDKEQTRIQN